VSIAAQWIIMQSVLQLLQLVMVVCGGARISAMEL